MSRIILFHPGLGGGGTSRVFVNLAKGFVQRGIDVDMVLLRAKGPLLKSLPSQVKVFEIKICFIIHKLADHLLCKHLGYLLSLRLFAFKLADYIRRSRPEAVLSASTSCNLISLVSRHLSGFRTRLTISERSTPSMCWANLSLGGSYLMLARKLYPQADAIIAVSQGVADDLCQLIGLPPNRVQVIYNPTITTDLFTKAQEPVNHPWFEKGQPPVILAVGMLRKEKDFPNLLRAFSLIRQVRPVRLVILEEEKKKMHWNNW